jgi:threonine/homoserine/homoserine lactone efflux protein
LFYYLALGLSTGLSAGISPGPLLALVVSASLRSGWAGGLRVALAPLITDAVIITVAVLLVDHLPPQALRWLGIAGGVVIIWIGIGILRSARTATLPDTAGQAADPNKELWRGVAVNALNPHPYLFWAAVGAPILVSAWRTSPLHALAFLLSFYCLLLGSKVTIAWLVSRSAGGLSLTWYHRILAVCGALMLTMGFWLMWQTWQSTVPAM